MIKKIFCTALNVVSVAAIVLALVALLSVVLTKSGDAPSIMGYSMLRVLTGSMEPAISTDSLVVTKQVDPAALQPGDVISFYSTDPQLSGAVNTHRIVAVEPDGAQYIFTTQGDANPLPDEYPVSSANIVGKVVYVSAALGAVVTFLTRPIAFFLLIALPLLGMVIYNLYKVIHSAAQAMKEEEKQAYQEALAAVQAARAAKQAQGDTPQEETEAAEAAPAETAFTAEKQDQSHLEKNEKSAAPERPTDEQSAPGEGDAAGAEPERQKIEAAVLRQEGESRYGREKAKGQCARKASHRYRRRQTTIRFHGFLTHGHARGARDAFGRRSLRRRRKK
jgi:signal peptidase